MLAWFILLFTISNVLQTFSTTEAAFRVRGGVYTCVLNFHKSYEVEVYARDKNDFMRNVWKFQEDTAYRYKDIAWSFFSFKILVFLLWPSLNMSTLRILISMVKLRDNFDLQMSVTNLCSSGWSFMSIAKYFRYKKIKNACPGRRR